MKEQLPLGTIEHYALGIAARSGLRQDFMPRAYAALKADGLIDSEGRATDAGTAILRAYSQARNRHNLFWNVLYYMKPDALEGLRKLDAGDTISFREENALAPHNGSMITRGPDGAKITKFGRSIVQLAADESV